MMKLDLFGQGWFYHRQMAKKTIGRAEPRIDEDELTDSFAEQVAGGRVQDAHATGALPAMKSMRGAGFEVARCLWQGVSLSETEAHRMQMRDVRVSGSDLARMNVAGGSLERVEFMSTRLTGLTVTETTLKSVLFRECKLDFASFRMARLSACVFERCNLTDADFYQADLSGTIFRDCDLSRADLSHARLTGADLRECRLDAVRGMPAEMTGLMISPDQAALLISLFGVKVVW